MTDTRPERTNDLLYTLLVRPIFLDIGQAFMSVAEVDPQNLSNKSNDSEKLGDETLLMRQSVFNTETTKEETLRDEGGEI